MSQRSVDPSKREVWLTALITGILTSTFSTLFIVFGSHRIGRDLSLSFMEVGTVLLRYSGVKPEPSWPEVTAGVAVYQGADIFWALLFWGAAARWTWRLPPAGLLAIAPFWAIATSAAEYYAILPWLQPLLIMLGRLMIAEQQAEIESQKRWWTSWFGGELPPPTPEEQATMLGMPPPGTLEQLATLSGPAFERRFLDVMIVHHEGAIEMANEAWARAADPRLRLFADQIRHPQVIQVERMQRLRRATPPQASGSEQR
jgi:hypothetical protein